MRGGEVPQIYGPPSSKMVSVGEAANFSCSARGRPQPTIQWLHDGRLLETNGTDNRSESVVRMDGENLLLSGVRSGVETVLCMATNSAGTANHTARLVVYDRRPDGWLHFNHSLYFISTITEKNWAASRDDCLERDADLIVINSREEQEFVGGLEGNYWIGLSDGDTEGTWKWVDGTNMTSSFWIPGEPNDNRGAEDCVATQERGDPMIMAMKRAGPWRTDLDRGWNDERCAALFRWICEKVLVLDHLEADLNKEVMRGGEVPQIYGHPSSNTVSVGEAANFFCLARGQPQPTIQWLQDGRLLETNGTDNRSASVVSMDGGDLVLRGVRSGVEMFLCMATNSAGTANHTARLLVYDRRPDGWLHYNHSLYFISTAKKNWTASRDDCLERDADLVVINSREEQVTECVCVCVCVLSQLCCHDNRYHYYLKQEFVGGLVADYWIGLSDRDTEGTWKWVDGTNMTSSFWGPGQPDDYGGEDCVVTRGGVGPERSWFDAPCGERLRWICEKV
ncbi:C-type lectin domain family 4 member E [Merluccius polli]|uniref:C-type lectin domain family 4 member E n=1 Tax=Merluccius polli TaxID=89951 RepID=A0AA47P7H8_MERPO|nr:C-type lectin domain family 4 member E [Merluccius polli]